MKTIIREKTLIRKMKKAYKSETGIRLGQDKTGNWIIIDGGSWIVYTDVRQLSNKVKAAIVEFAGGLPDEGVEARFSEKNDMPESEECEEDVQKILGIDREVLYRLTFLKLNTLPGMEVRALQEDGKSNKVYVREDDLTLIDYELFNTDIRGVRGPRSTPTGYYITFTDGSTFVSLETVTGETIEMFSNTIKTLGERQIEHMTYGV